MSHTNKTIRAPLPEQYDVDGLKIAHRELQERYNDLETEKIKYAFTILHPLIDSTQITRIYV